VSVRLTQRWESLRQAGKPAFIPYIMGGEPDSDATVARLHGLVAAGADILELGFPFTDPTADGPVIEAAGRRALAAGAHLDTILEMVRRFRADDPDTPLILMGYTNPVLALGLETFAAAAADAGTDGALIVDTPPEEDTALRGALEAAGLALVRLITPTTSDERRARILRQASGFVYYVAEKGVTGGAGLKSADLAEALSGLKAASAIPVVVGFGVSTPEDAARLAPQCDGVVVGSALVRRFHEDGDEAALAHARALAETAALAEAGAAATCTPRVARLRAPYARPPCDRSPVRLRPVRSDSIIAAIQPKRSTGSK